MTFTTQYTILKKEKEYSFRIENIIEKIKLYEETIDIFQIIINDLQPNLIEKVKSEESIIISNRFSNVMNRNILYFNESIGKRIEQSIKNNYWNITNTEIETILKAMAKEIKEEKKKIRL